MKWVWFALAVAAVGCSRSTPPLPVYGSVPQFTLTAQDGRQFSSGELKGKVWVSDFFFTSCMGPCPRMTSQMHSIAAQVRDLPQVRFVSFTVDPEHDTPTVLASYAVEHHADTARWFFLTGAQPALQVLDRRAFKLGDVDGSLMHSTRFVLVDQRGRIRGYYRTDEGNGLGDLVPDIRRLVRETS